MTDRICKHRGSQRRSVCPCHAGGSIATGVYICRNCKPGDNPVNCVATESIRAGRNGIVACETCSEYRPLRSCEAVEQVVSLTNAVEKAAGCYVKLTRQE